jgi:glutamyl-tRNA reductase
MADLERTCLTASQKRPVGVQRLLEALSRGATQEMLHSPTAGLQAAERDGGDERVAQTNRWRRLCLQCPMRGQR